MGLKDFLKKRQKQKEAEQFGSAETFFPAVDDELVSREIELRGRDDVVKTEIKELDDPFARLARSHDKAVLRLKAFAPPKEREKAKDEFYKRHIAPAQALSSELAEVTEKLGANHDAMEEVERLKQAAGYSNPNIER